MNCVSAEELQKFRESTADFLEPLSDADMACNFNLCGHSGGCLPVQFKCSFGPENVTLLGTKNSDIRKARMQCAGSDDIDVEPVGGQGGMVVTPIRDDVRAEFTFHQKNNRRQNKKELQILLFVMIVVAIYLTFR